MSDRRSAPPGRRPRVVCVDDEPMVLAALERALRREPYELVTTQDPAEALRLLEDGVPSLIVTDLRMPGMSGEDLIREVRRLHPRTGHLMLTAYPDVASALLRESGTVIAKPWNNDSLRTRLWECLGPMMAEAAADSVAEDEASSLIADVERALQQGQKESADPSSGRT